MTKWLPTLISILALAQFYNFIVLKLTSNIDFTYILIILAATFYLFVFSARAIYLFIFNVPRFELGRGKSLIHAVV